MMSSASTILDQPPVMPSGERRRRVLLVSYHFPPVGGAGVQRPLKFVKYLQQFGWDASVLMAANPSVPVLDESLCRDLPEDLVVVKARTWEPGYQVKQQLAQSQAGQSSWLSRCKSWVKRGIRSVAGCLLQPDPQVLWHPAAYPAARQLLRELPHDAILATAPSYSNLLLALKLKRATGLPLIVDFRDEWDLSSQYLENSRRDWYSQWTQERQQRRVLRGADWIVATTPGSTQRLQDRARQAGSRTQASCIFNGFDPDDFTAAPAVPTANDRFKLVYTGTLWNLTDISPVVKAIEKLHSEFPELLSRLELQVVGRKTPEQIAVLERLRQTRCRLELVDYLPHSDALNVMSSADALCLLLSDVPGAERVAPAKLFEYLAWKKPILAVTPDGDTARIVRRFSPRSQFVPGDVAGITNWLCEQLALYPGPVHSLWTPPSDHDLTEFTRRHQAGQLANLLQNVVHAASPHK